MLIAMSGEYIFTRLGEDSAACHPDHDRGPQLLIALNIISSGCGPFRIWAVIPFMGSIDVSLFSFCINPFIKLVICNPIICLPFKSTFHICVAYQRNYSFQRNIEWTLFNGMLTMV